MAAGRLPWGKDHHRVYRTLLYHRLQIGVACEDLPEEHNRVTLDPVLKDGHGIPAPRIDYTISENTRRLMEHGIGARHRRRHGDFLRRRDHDASRARCTVTCAARARWTASSGASTRASEIAR
jgi:hypothetical protein